MRSSMGTPAIDLRMHLRVSIGFAPKSGCLQLGTHVLRKGANMTQKLQLHFLSFTLLAIIAATVFAGCASLAPSPDKPQLRESIPDGQHSEQPAQNESMDESLVAVSTNSFITETYADGAIAQYQYKREIDERGNVVSYSTNITDEWQHFELTYDDYGIPLSCEGDTTWTQSVIEWSSDQHPAVVQRDKGELGVTTFTFEYFDDGRIKGYTIESPTRHDSYYLNGSGEIISSVKTTIEENGAETSTTSSETTYEENPQNRTISMLQTNDDGSVIEAQITYDEKGVPVEYVERDELGNSSSEVSEYKEISNPSEMVKIWSQVFYRTNPLSVPAF